MVPGNLGVQLQGGLEGRAEEKALAGHVVDISLHIAAGVDALQVGVATMELRAQPGHGLGLERMQDQITLGREVVIQATRLRWAARAARRMVSRLAP